MILYIVERLDSGGNPWNLNSWDCLLLTDDLKSAREYILERGRAGGTSSFADFEMKYDRFRQGHHETDVTLVAFGLLHRIRAAYVENVMIGEKVPERTVNAGLGPPPESIGRAHTEPVPEPIEDDTVSRFRQLELD